MGAHWMRKDEFEFDPECTLLIATNHRPDISDETGGMWRRVRLIPFDARFEDDAAEPGLVKTLSGEAEGILAWAAGKALAEYGYRDIAEPVALSDAEVSFFEEMDGRYRAATLDAPGGWSVLESDNDWLGDCREARRRAGRGRGRRAGIPRRRSGSRRRGGR